MPSPIAHSVSGYVLAQLPFVKNRVPGRLWSVTPLAALYGIFVSNLPDLDFVPQFITGIRMHRGPSHSLLMALIVSSLLAWGVHRYRRRQASRRESQLTEQPSLSTARASYGAIFGITFGLYSLHLFLDLFTTGGSGLPLLWPLSEQTFRSPVPLFPPAHHSRGLWDASHIVFITFELIYSVCLLAGLQFFKSSRASSKAAKPHGSMRRSQDS
jgi:inner membrane protein